MIKHRYPRLLLAAAIAALASMSAIAAPAHASAKTKAADAAKSKTVEPAKPESQVVEYKELEHHIGAELAIETTFNTIRHGVLTKYTNPGLKILLGPEAGSIELDVPAETIRSVSIVTPATPATPAAPPQGTSSAKKN
jgi:hypothetical protein